ncbi:MAG: class I SAM-dependent methyltransferase [Clostridia bacterium]|nr:class I SAM-dependent methyltransferase [Clostridia bacterium]
MQKNNWNLYAPIYNLFMRKDHQAYEQMYRKIRRAIDGKTVLELAAGTGLIAKNVASAAAQVEATDFAEKMIAEARRGNNPFNLTFRVADATALPYRENSFDVVIISNALHIMPEPEKALQEIQRVLKPDGLLIAPTFVHGNMRMSKRLLSRAMSLVGFQAEHPWTAKEYQSFLEEHGWNVRYTDILRASFPLMYVECII